MLTPTVYYLRVVDLEHVAAKKGDMKAIGKITETAREVYEGLPL